MSYQANNCTLHDRAWRNAPAFAGPTTDVLLTEQNLAGAVACLAHRPKSFDARIAKAQATLERLKARRRSV